MARRNTTPGEGQIDMITAQFSGPDFASVSLVEQARYLSDATSHFDTVAASEPFLRAAQNPAVRSGLVGRYGSNTDKVIAGFQNRHDEALKAAAEAFAKGFGRYALIDSPFIAESEVDAYIAPYFEQFQGVFRGATRADKRERYRTHLSQRTANAQPIDSDLQETARPKADMNATGRIALARVLRVEYLGKQTGDYAAVGFELIRSLQPWRLKRELLTSGGRHQNSLRYIDDEGKRQYVTVAPHEWDILIRSTPEDLAQVAINRSKKKSQHTPEDLPVDEDSPRRAGLHAVEERRKKMSEYLDVVIEPYVVLLDKFQEATQHNGGLARFGNEATMRQQFEFLRTFVLGDMLYALGARQDLSRKQLAEVELAMEAAIFAPSEHGVRLKNFAAVIGLAEEWYQAKAALFRGRIHEADRYITDHSTEDELVR